MYRRAYDTTKLVYHPKKSVLNELLLYAALHERTYDDTYLAEMSALLEEIKPDLAAKPRNYLQLRTFAEGGKAELTIDDDDLQALVTEVKERWPTMKDVTSANLQRLYQGLLGQEISVPYKMLRPFIAEGCFRASQIEQDPGELVDDVLANVARVMGQQSTAPKSDSEEAMILRIVIEKLKESVEAGRGSRRSWRKWLELSERQVWWTYGANMPTV